MFMYWPSYKIQARELLFNESGYDLSKVPV